MKRFLSPMIVCVGVMCGGIGCDAPPVLPSSQPEPASVASAASDPRVICVQRTPQQCRDALDRAKAQGHTLAAHTEFWLDALLHHPTLRAVALRELDPEASVIQPDSDTITVLIAACFNDDAAACAHVRRIDHTTQRPFWDAMSCAADDIDACMRVALPAEITPSDDDTCTPTQHGACWARAHTLAERIQAQHGRCQSGDERACWDALMERALSASSEPDALARAELACQCEGLRLRFDSAQGDHIAYHPTCTRVAHTRASLNRTHVAREALDRCIQGDREACNTAADVLASSDHTTLFGYREDTALAQALRERLCRGDTPHAHACFALGRYDQALPGLEDACAQNDPTACAALGAVLAQTHATYERGLALLKSACIKHDLAACKRYAIDYPIPHGRFMTHKRGLSLLDLKNLSERCLQDEDHPYVCNPVGELVRDGIEPLPPSPNAAQPYFQRACAQGHPTACEDVAPSARLDALAAACAGGVASHCLRLADALSASSPSDATRANAAACRLGDIEGCRRADLPVRLVCRNPSAPHRAWACLLACAEGDPAGCEGSARDVIPYLEHSGSVHTVVALPGDPPIIPKTDEAQRLRAQRVDAQLQAACARGHLLSCYGRAMLIRRGAFDPNVAQARQGLAPLLHGMPSIARHSFGHTQPEPLPDTPTAAQRARWRAVAARAARKAAPIERDAHARAQAACAVDDARGCSELARLDLYQLVHVDGAVSYADAPERWDAITQKLAAACAQNAKSACLALSTIAADPAHRDDPFPALVRYAQATAHLCIMQDASGCIQRAELHEHVAVLSEDMVAWLERGCALGRGEACRRAGELLFWGTGYVDRDVERGEALLRRGCALGERGACYSPSRAVCVGVLRGL